MQDQGKACKEKLNARNGIYSNLQGVAWNEVSMSKSKAFGLSSVWRKGNTYLQEVDVIQWFLCRYGQEARRSHAGKKKQQSRIQQKKLYLGDQKDSAKKSEIEQDNQREVPFGMGGDIRDFIFWIMRKAFKGMESAKSYFGTC